MAPLPQLSVCATGRLPLTFAQMNAHCCAACGCTPFWRWSTAARWRTAGDGVCLLQAEHSPGEGLWQQHAGAVCGRTVQGARGVRRCHAALPRRQGRAHHGPGVPTRERRTLRRRRSLALSVHGAAHTRRCLMHTHRVIALVATFGSVNSLARCSRHAHLSESWALYQQKGRWHSRVSVHRAGGPVLSEDGH